MGASLGFVGEVVTVVGERLVAVGEAVGGRGHTVCSMMLQFSSGAFPASHELQSSQSIDALPPFNVCVSVSYPLDWEHLQAVSFSRKFPSPV